MTKIISIVNQKGGTGKTTTTVNLARALSDLGNKVLMIDLDSQGSLSYYLGVSNSDKSITDIILGDSNFFQSVVVCEGMDLITSNMSLADLELSLINYNGREIVLKQLLRQHADIYDYILIDCSPSLSVLTINALVASTHILIPLQLEVLSLHGLELILNTVDSIKSGPNPDLEVLGILLLRYDEKSKITQEVYEHLLNTYDFVNIFKTLIRNDDKFVEAPSFGQSIIEYAPESDGAKDYKSLATEVTDLLQSSEF